MSRSFWKNRQRNSQTINRLSLVSADLVGKKVLNNFLLSSAPDSLKLFHLEYKGEAKNILDGLSRILATVTYEIYLDGLTIDTKEIKKIIEASFTVKRLVFKDCKISLTDHLLIDTSRKYQFAELWFFNCFNSDIQGLKMIFGNLSISNLWRSDFTLVMNYHEEYNILSKLNNTFKSETERVINVVVNSMTEHFIYDFYNNGRYEANFTADKNSLTPVGFKIQKRSDFLEYAMIKNSLRHGYARHISNENNGEYSEEGFRFKGNVFGLYKLKNPDGSVRYQVYENGNLVKDNLSCWERRKINKGSLCWTKYFKDPESIDSCYGVTDEKTSIQRFNPPIEFDILYEEAKYRMKILKGQNNAVFPADLLSDKGKAFYEKHKELYDEIRALKQKNFDEEEKQPEGVNQQYNTKEEKVMKARIENILEDMSFQKAKVSILKNIPKPQT